ncbi:MAG: hypothetical protein GY799_00330 [Desulfobulbaceae bacterium]|nr:hypothetical protein [Desulfobulbaceae bacterium]
MLKNLILSLATLAIIFSLSSTNLMAQDNNSPAGKRQQKKQSPFLITGELPHLTKLLMQQWDNSTLHLTEDQKPQLLVVRNETMAGVKNLAPQIASLQKQVTEGIFIGKTPDELHSNVQAISKLKAEATMIHLKCIFDTSKILNQQQLDILLKQ